MTEANFYLVGGAVRDSLLGIQSKDLDYSVEAQSFDHMREAILERGGKIYLETPQHFTIRGKVPGLGDSDFVLCRKDGAYSDGRRPDSVEQGTLMDDLARRDFTVNAMARAEDGSLIDPFCGELHLKTKLLFCVGDTDKRMSEDALRMMRAIRFAITKGFSFSGALSRFLRDESNAKLLDNVSIERIREELKKCFDCNTRMTIEMLMLFPAIFHHIFSRNIKLSPIITT